MRRVNTISVVIYIAGDATRAREVCRDYYASTSGCVTVTETEYVYTGGTERGVIVGFINYPPYPVASEAELIAKALSLANVLLRELGQQSYTIQGPTQTLTYGRDHVIPGGGK